MKQIDRSVLDTTRYILVWEAVLSLLMQAVFLISGFWDYRVLLGNLLSGTASVLNFFFMGLTVQNAVQKEEKAAKAYMSASQTARMFALFLVMMIGVLAPCFQILAVLIPFLFPRIAISAQPVVEKYKNARRGRE